MLVNVVKVKLKPGSLAEFKLLVTPLVNASQKETGCIEYHVYHDINDPLMVCFIEKWQDQEALNIHETLPHFTNVIDKLILLCAEPAIKNKFSLIE